MEKDKAADVVGAIQLIVDARHDLREHLAAFAEVADSEVSACAFRAADEVGWIVEGAGLFLDLIDHAGLQIAHDGTWNEASAAAFTELREEGTPVPARHFSIKGLTREVINIVLLADRFPKGRGNLIACLADRYNDCVVNLHYPTLSLCFFV